MSGTRTPARELVFCHACENEFYKNGDGLTCPECHSDFTELVGEAADGNTSDSNRSTLGLPDDFAQRLERCVEALGEMDISPPTPNPSSSSPSRRSASGPMTPADLLGTMDETRRARPSDQSGMIDPDFDPRSTDDRHPDADDALVDALGRSRYTWDSAQDPDEADIDEYQRIPGSSYRDRRGQTPYGRSNPYTAREDPFGSMFESPLLGNLSSMVQTITGGRPGPYQSPQSVPPGMPPFPGFQNRRPSNSNTGPEIYSRSYPSRGGFHISFSTNAGGGGWTSTTRQRGDFNEFGDVNEMLQSMFGGGPGARGGMGQPGNPLAAIFNQLLNPANAQHGDAVFSQEAFDRVMSQLMEQHVSGTAPGPASEAAIAALPRKKVTDDMLDENTKQAECAICMDDVVVGQEVTTLPCGHWFDHACVEAWLKEHDTCPVCRAGIMPKDGPSDVPRSPGEAPMHNEDPVHVARRQSGTRDHPYIVSESPTASRRRPNPRRHSSAEESSGGITGRMRSFFGGGGGGASSSSSNNRR